MSHYLNVYLKRGREASLQRFHPWIFSGAIARVDHDVSDGSLVRVLSASGDFIAVGFFQQGSIAVRVLSFDDISIDEPFWESRLRSALSLRKALGLVDNPQNTAFRLVHGEGDSLPGVVIDCYGETAVMQAHCIGAHLHRQALCTALVKVMEGRIKSVYYKSEGTLPFMADKGLNDGFLYGEEAQDTTVENGLTFTVDWRRGQKTGFFIDQRENRSLLERYAKDRTVLNMFCYTGGFSVYAMRGGARMVHSVDSSAKAIDLTERNVELNFPQDTRHKAFCADAFSYLEGSNDDYDLLILDPPAFAKHRSALHNALKGYTRLNLKGLEHIRRGGILFTFSCSQAVSKEQFRDAVLTAAVQSGRRVRILHQLHQPADHPVNIYHPEGEYLKGLVLYVE